ncbi:hypothetical protein [Paraferrimonas sp. SM1919]|uniref:hypothetical protein n=1 Tax=Paraferrimonas sp. SM1919 TaxID=2662263 RepID=UPI0013D34CFA|nr:hypothetical protein [Paraferrimonas sp. SM1919]
MKKLLLLLLWLQLSACSAVLYKMTPERTLNQQQLNQLQPAQVQVKVNLEQTAQLNIEKTKLTLQAMHNGTSVEQVFRVKLIKRDKLGSDSGWLSVMPASYDYYLVLTTDAISQMNEFIDDYRNKSITDIRFNLEAGFSRVGKQKQACYSSFIRLHEDDYYNPINQRQILDL